MSVVSRQTELRTERLLLREMSAGDADRLLAIRTDPEVIRYWGGEPMKTLAQAQEEIERVHGWVERGECWYWAVADPDQGRYLGHITIFRINAFNRNGEIGYMLDRAAWGRGLMLEAAKAVLDFAFGVGGLHRVEADVDPDNKASHGLLERLGFSEEGYFRERWKVEDGWADSIMLGLLARDWQSSASN